MKDFLGNEINIGDKVIFIEKRNGGAKLTLGTVSKIDSGIAYMKIKYPEGMNMRWLGDHEVRVYLR